MTKPKSQEGTRPIPSHLHVSGNCLAVHEVLSRVGDKWSVLVVSSLGNGPMRFNELRRALGTISQRMLTLTGRALGRGGLITRTVYPSIPPRVNYERPALGCSLLEPVKSRGEGAVKTRPAIQAARQRFDG